MTSAVKRSYPFGSRPTSLVDETHQFKVPQAPLHKKMSMTPSINSPAETSWRMNKASMNVAGNSIVVPDSKTVTTVNGEKSPLPSPPSAKGRRNMKNLQLVVPPVRSSISAPSSPQLPQLPSSHTHSRRPSTPLCVYQNKGQDNSNTAADPMELMSKTENAIGEELPYKDEPILILPNLYLGSELNAANRTMLNRINIEFILNVAKEVENPYLEEIVNHGTSYNDEYQDSPMSESVCSDDSFRTAIQSPMGASNNIDSPMVPPSSFGEFFTTSINKRSSSTPRPTFTSAQNSMQSGIPLIVPSTSDFSSLKYKKFFWTHNQENLNSDFPSAFAFIDEARSAGRNILVHCQCGVSRSASLIIGYVMKANRMTLNQAYEYVKNKSPCISPNMSLVYQLVDFEKTLKLGSNNGTNCSSPGTPTRCKAESIKTHSRSSSIESDLLLKTHRRSTSIPRSNPVLSIAPAYGTPEPSPKTPPVVTEGLLTTHLPRQSTVKGGSGRFHVITASISPTSPSAPSPSSPASSVSPTSSESPTTPSSGSSSPSKNSSKSLPPSKNGHLTVSNRSRSPLSSDRTPLTPREIINTPMSPTFATSKSMSTATLHNSSIASIPYDNLSYARTSRILGRNHSMIGHEVLSGSASGIFSKSTLESIFSPTRTSPPVTPVTIPNIHDIFLDDE